MEIDRIKREIYEHIRKLVYAYNEMMCNELHRDALVILKELHAVQCDLLLIGVYVLIKEKSNYIVKVRITSDL